jgi:rhodanese-related sulfurtransferase
MFGIKMQWNYKIKNKEKGRRWRNGERKIDSFEGYFFSPFPKFLHFSLIFFFCVFSFAVEAYESLSPRQIMTLSKENPSEYIFLDVNQDNSVLRIPGSIIISVEKIDKNYSSLDSNKTIVVYCEKGIRSLEASKKLSALGAKKVINMEGGIEAWEKAGGKVEKKTVPLNKGNNPLKSPFVKGDEGVVSTPFWPGGTCEIKLPE